MTLVGRRLSRRFDVLDVEGSFVVRVDVRVVNLSIAGMAIEADSPLVVGRRYDFRMAQGERRVDLGGRVVWCVDEPGRSRGGDYELVYRAGVQFEDVHDGQALALQRLIEASAAFSPDSSLPGRFVPPLGERVGSDEPAWFEVRKLSLSGMLVDTERLPSMDEVFPFEAHLGKSLVSGYGRVACAERYACNDGSARFRVGVEFTQLSDRCRDLLDHYLARLIGQSRR